MRQSILRRSVSGLVAGAFLHEERDEIANPAAFEPGVLLADESADVRRRGARKLVNQSTLDIRQQHLFAHLNNFRHNDRVANGVVS